MTEKIKFDNFDLKIMEILQEDGRITKLALSERIARSQTPCHVRVKRLEKIGVVSGYHAEIDIDKLINITMVFVTVTLERHKYSDFVRFEKAMAQIPEVVQCFALGGGIDYIMTVVCRNITLFQDLMDKMLADDLGIAQYFSYVVTKKVKKRTGLPILHLFEDAK